MLYSVHYIKDAIFRLKAIISSNKEGVNQEDTKDKISLIMPNLIMACEELSFTTEKIRFMEAKQDIIKFYNDIREDNDEEELLKRINNKLTMIVGILEMLDAESHDTYDFTSSARSKVISVIPLQSYPLTNVLKDVEVPNREIKVLDIKANDGSNLLALTGLIKSPVVTYGIEKDQYRASQARDRIDRVAMGQMSGSRITNNAFDIMMIEPQISWKITRSASGAVSSLKTERSELTNTLKYLRPDGIGVTILPYFRLYKDTCVTLAKMYSDIEVRGLGEDFMSYGLVAIVGKKKASTRDVDEKSYKTLRACYNKRDIKDINESPITGFTVPTDGIEIEMFRGSVLDPEELKQIVETSGCREEFWESQRVEKISEGSKQPLLPFNIGQIGLVLTSGCLDGIVDEGNGNYHLIKGRVSKQSSVEKNYEGERVEIEETVSNRVEINVLLPNGEYKILA